MTVESTPVTVRGAARGLALGVGAAALGYAGLVVFHRARYGKVAAARSTEGESPLLDRFIPVPEVVEHHRVRIAAPADIVLSTAREADVLESPVIRAIFRVREMALGGRSDTRPRPRGLLSQMLSIGWVILAERPGREIVVGAVTKPWESDTVFRSIPAPEFAAFREPGYVKIVWTLRADPIDGASSVFHTETRVATTDAHARTRFRTYWSLVAPGVELIRLAMLRPLKRAAERRASTRSAPCPG
jgi:hypothetical protein